jgi:ankyrin repeat protein
MASVAGPNTAEHIVAILKANGIDPDTKTSNGQTAFEVLERHIAGALEEIEDED